AGRRWPPAWPCTGTRSATACAASGSCSGSRPSIPSPPTSSGPPSTPARFCSPAPASTVPKLAPMASDPAAGPRPDLLVTGGDVVTMNPAREVLVGGAGAVGGDRIVGGVATLAEAGTVARPDRVAKAVAAVGVRGTVGTWGWDVEQGPFAAPAEEVLERQRAVLRAHPRGGQVEGWVTLVGHNLASDELL